MTTITATNLRANLFEILERISKKGEVFSIKWNNAEVAEINPKKKKRPWQDNIKIKAKINTKKPMDAFAPLEDVWEGYI